MRELLNFVLSLKMKFYSLIILVALISAGCSYSEKKNLLEISIGAHEVNWRITGIAGFKKFKGEKLKMNLEEDMTFSLVSQNADLELKGEWTVSADRERVYFKFNTDEGKNWSSESVSCPVKMEGWEGTLYFD